MAERYRLLRNVRFYDTGKMRTDACDFFYRIDGGKSEVLRVGKNLRVGEIEGLNVVNLHGACAASPFVDLRCSIPDPGYAYRESMQSGLNAALAGGYGSVLLMPTTKPTCDSAASAEAYAKTAKNAGVCRARFCAPLTKGGKGSVQTDLALLKRAGVCAVACDYEEKEAAAETVVSALQRAQEEGMLFIAACKKSSLHRKGQVNSGRIAGYMRLQGVGTLGELMAVGEAITLARYTGCPLHFPLVTLSEGVAAIRRAKDEGLPITCGTAPQYFAFDENEALFSGSRAKFDPPLRSEEDKAAVIEGLRDGTIDCICTDHTPLAAAEKSDDITSALPGAVGLDTAFSAGVTHLVLPGYLSILELLSLLGRNPRAILGEKPASKVGGTMDLMFFDVDRDLICTQNTLRSRSSNTPFLGRVLKGAVTGMIIDGERIF